MSFDMLPDSAIAYLIEHQGCPRDHSTCLVEPTPLSALQQSLDRRG